MNELVEPIPFNEKCSPIKRQLQSNFESEEAEEVKKGSHNDECSISSLEKD